MKSSKNLFLLFIAMMLLAAAPASRAGGAIWNSSPTTGDWNTAANWTPATVPNGPADTATFDVSNNTGVSLSATTEVNGIVFNPGASAYTITIPDKRSLTLSGAGITNNATATESIATEGDLVFMGNALAGNAVLNNRGGSTFTDYSYTIFKNNASADHATITNDGGEKANFPGAGLFFLDDATAGRAVITNQGGTNRAAGGITGFNDRSTAADCVITVNGASVPTAIGILVFAEESTAGTATLIVNTGDEAGDGGKLSFVDASAGGMARIQLFGYGHCDISGHAQPGVTIGSLEGNGTVELGARTLSVGSNGLSTTFSGVLKDGGISGEAGGVVEKLGTGNLTLSGASTYAGGTIVSGGALKVANTTGSATGTGAVAVNSGTLGGNGTIAGAITIGTSGGAGAFLAPAAGSAKQASFTSQSALILKADATYICTFKATRGKARTDVVNASGVTVESGATFAFSGAVRGQLQPGLTLTAINNTSAAPIAGTFGNLPDGGTITVGSINFQAHYEGGDGNDLTLTVVP